MASTAAERLFEAHRTYHDAYTNRTRDRRDAGSMAEVRAIDRNLQAAEAAYNRAGTLMLSETGALVERAYKGARDANDKIDTARQSAAALPARIQAVTDAVTKVNALITAAKKKT